MSDDSTQPDSIQPDSATPAPTPHASTPAAPTPADSSPAPPASAPPVAVPPVVEVDTGYTAAGVPTLEGVREKIETRYGTALGATELAEATPEARTATERYEAQQKAAAEKLAEIRDSMRTPDKPGPN